MRGIVRWQSMAEGLKHTAPPRADLWARSPLCLPTFTCSAHSSCSFQLKPSPFPVLTAERVFNLALYEMQHTEKRLINDRWWKHPAQFPRVLAHPMCKDPSTEGACFPNCIFHVPSLGVWRSFILFLGEPGVWRREGAPAQPRLLVGGFALCWIKADLLKFFLIEDIREPADSFAQRNIAFRKQFQPNKHFRTYYLTL